VNAVQIAVDIVDSIEDESSPEPDTCRPVEVDGETILVRGSGELDDTSHQAFTEVYRAAKRRMEAEKEAERAQIRAEAAEEITALLKSAPEAAVALLRLGGWLGETKKAALDRQQTAMEGNEEQ